MRKIGHLKSRFAPVGRVRTKSSAWGWWGFDTNSAFSPRTQQQQQQQRTSTQQTTSEIHVGLIVRETNSKNRTPHTHTTRNTHTDDYCSSCCCQLLKNAKSGIAKWLVGRVADEENEIVVAAAAAAAYWNSPPAHRHPARPTTGFAPVNRCDSRAH